MRQGLRFGPPPKVSCCTAACEGADPLARIQPVGLGRRIVTFALLLRTDGSKSKPAPAGLTSRLRARARQPPGLPPGGSGGREFRGVSQRVASERSTKEGAPFSLLLLEHRATPNDALNKAALYCKLSRNFQRYRPPAFLALSHFTRHFDEPKRMRAATIRNATPLSLPFAEFRLSGFRSRPSRVWRK